MTTDTFKRDDKVEYFGPYVNARGIGKFLSYEHEGSMTWAVVRINGAIHRVGTDNLSHAA